MLEIMSSGTRAQQAQVHERLLRRAQNFQPSLRQAHVLRQVALGTLQDYRADATFVQEEVANSIRNKVPSINSFLEEEYLASPTYPIPLLRDIATFYGCLAMPALETVQDKFVATSPLRQFCWILITLNEVPMEDLNDLVMMIVPLRQAPLPQIAAKLHSASTRVIEATVQAAGPARSEGSERRIAPEHGRLPPRKHDLQLQPEANRPPNSIREGNRPTGQSYQELASTVQAIYGSFKGKKFSGDALQCIPESIRDYNILGFQLGLSDKMRAKFFVCIFEDSAKSHFIVNIREDLSYAEMERIM
eukprot:gb/GEZJ01004743.1/.p1 GENE.gb/GEZJ01004743.1/~~gb/GEZJ01004743.1/.p1  ORF type:complete len:304 (+),score=44.27 gb/GEZJ01004743.1/:53-964(+)